MAKEKTTLSPMASTLATYLKDALSSEETRSAALAEVARKLLADNNFQYDRKAIVKVESALKKAPTVATVDGDIIPPLRALS